MDDPRNTDNAWIETVAISIHFPDQNDVELKRLNSVRGWAPGEGEAGGVHFRHISEAARSAGGGLPVFLGPQMLRPESGGC
jgi:hypothetical protein